MKYFTDKLLLGSMMFGLALTGGLLVPNTVRAADPAEIPIEVVSEMPEVAEGTEMLETAEVSSETPEDLEMTDVAAAETPEVAAVETPEVTTTPDLPQENPTATTQPDPAADPPQPQPKSKKGLKILFGILQLLGNELTQ